MTDDPFLRAALARHERPLLIYAARLLGDAERARDVVQDTFLKLCARPRSEVADHLGEWLYTVCRNRCLDVRRKERRMTTGGDGTTAEPILDEEPARLVEAREQGSRVLQLLARLPAKQQEVLRLRFQAGLKYAEIARVTGESIGNVGTLIHVGLKNLRARMGAGALDGKV